MRAHLDIYQNISICHNTFVNIVNKTIIIVNKNVDRQAWIGMFVFDY